MRGCQRECSLDIWMALEWEARARNNGWTMSGQICSLQGNPKTGQAGGLPQNVCCNAPDLRIGKRVMND